MMMKDWVIDPNLILALAVLGGGGFASFVTLRTRHDGLESRVKHLEKQSDEFVKEMTEIKILLARIAEKIGA